MKLLFAHASPFARKVRVVLAEKGLACEFVEENVWSADSRVPQFNPIGKIPTLILDDGSSLYDSRVITEYLEGLGGRPLMAAHGWARTQVRRRESLADGICDAAVLIVVERRRDCARQDPGWMDRQRAKIDAGLRSLAGELDSRTWLDEEGPGLGDLAAGCAVFYLEFRLPEIDWRTAHPNLSAWAGRLALRPSFQGSRPPSA